MDSGCNLQPANPFMQRPACLRLFHCRQPTPMLQGHVIWEAGSARTPVRMAQSRRGAGQST
eukprot:263164-Amphidinium_carterae.3